MLTVIVGVVLGLMLYQLIAEEGEAGCGCLILIICCLILLMRSCA